MQGIRIKLKFESLIFMDIKNRKQQERKKEKKEMILFVIVLVIIFFAVIFLDRKFKRKIVLREFEGEVQTYDGSLHRNISNPLGLE